MSAQSTAGRWTARADWIRTGLRAVGIAALAFTLVRAGLFDDPRWVVLTTAAAWLLMVVVAVLRLVRPFDVWSAAAIAAMMVLGAVVNPQLQYLGMIFVVVGGMILVSRPEVPPRLAATLVGVTGVLTVVIAGVSEHSWSVVFAVTSGMVAIGFFGALRRQTRVAERETARVAALEERSRIARDLHDVLAHALGGLVVQLEAADAQLAAGDTEAAATRLSASRRLAVEGLRDARAAVQQLRAEGASEGARDLVAAVDTVLRGPVGLHLGARLEVVGPARPVAADVAETLAAVAREALTNVNKHAAGQQVTAALVFEPGRLRLEVVSGLGSSPASDLAASGTGLGLAGLAERVTRLGGRLLAGVEGRRWVVSAQCPSP